jgi:4-hydroxy-3-polyprenylbenzoate decarboxylase
VVVALTGATGAIYGIRLLEALGGVPGVETHLVVSSPAKRTLVEETDYSVRDVERLAHVLHDVKDIGASIASGSFRTAGWSWPRARSARRRRSRPASPATSSPGRPT